MSFKNLFIFEMSFRIISKDELRGVLGLVFSLLLARGVGPALIGLGSSDVGRTQSLSAIGKWEDSVRTRVRVFILQTVNIWTGCQVR